MTAAVELDAQYRQLREECGLLDRSERGKLLVAGRGGGRVPAGAADQRRRGARARRGLLRGVAGPQGAHAGRHAGAAAWRRTRSGSTPSQRALAAARRHLETYKIGREVEVEDVTASAAILSLIGPRSVELAGTAALPEHTCERCVAGVECLAVGTARRRRPDRARRATPSRLRRRAGRGRRAPRCSAEAAEILRIEAGVPRFGAEMGTETMPAEAGIVERASASPRAATSARRRSPASTTRASRTATCAGCG